MEICAFALRGFEGQLIKAETDMRKGLPGTEIIGLPDSAVKESKERVRVAIKNCGFDFPRERLLINLTPAGVKKEGATFDLAIALAILLGSGQIVDNATAPQIEVLALGELELSGRVRSVPGVLSAMGSAIDQGIQHIIIPLENSGEAMAIAKGRFWPVATLPEAVQALQAIAAGQSSPLCIEHTPKKEVPLFEVDLKHLKGQKTVKRALEIAASGRHNLFLFGPPGCGKTMACKALQSILPPLTYTQSLETSRIYSVKGQLAHGLMEHPPFRQPHHSASSEGIIGGGRQVLPGEISLAHNGVLFLDEAPEFGKNLLQNLREPLENKRVSLVRAGLNTWYPADFQLLMASNVCPCGAMGRNDRSCLCSPHEVSRYWKRIGGAILDRIDMRLPVQPITTETLLTADEESSYDVAIRVRACHQVQQERYVALPFKANAQLPSSHIKEFCALNARAERAFLLACQKLSLSARAGHSILRIARTIADMDGSSEIEAEHALEATAYRRYGDNDLYWMEI